MKRAPEKPVAAKEKKSKPGGRKPGQSLANIKPDDDYFKKKRMVEAGSFDYWIFDLARRFWTLSVIQQPAHPESKNAETIALTRKVARDWLAATGGAAAEKLDAGFFERFARALQHFKDKDATVVLGKNGKAAMFKHDTPNLARELLKIAEDVVPDDPSKGLEIPWLIEGHKPRRATFKEIVGYVHRICYPTPNGEDLVAFGNEDEATIRAALKKLGILYDRAKPGRKREAAK